MYVRINFAGRLTRWGFLVNYNGGRQNVVYMPTSIDLFDYELPSELIAQHSVEPRDQSRLLLLNKQTGGVEHKRFFEIIDELQQGDVLVMNNTKVFRARLRGLVNDREIEVFLLRPDVGIWQAMVRPGRRVCVGDRIEVGEMSGEVVTKSDVFAVRWDRDDQAVIDYANEHGEIPIPPYVEQVPDSIDKYQTVYAKDTGSVAAPTAGFHFTAELLSKIREKDVQIEEVTLHVGLGTFRPVKVDTLEEHQMHSEWVSIEAGVARRINEAKTQGRRVIAVGTTTVRTLEGVAALSGKVMAYTADVNLFITPGFEFKVVDALITNFHLPKSTLLVLVSALAGREQVLAAYQEAVERKYRFFSFGDAMFIG